TLPQDALLSWGWRVPFLLSLLLVAFGIVVRLRVEESPDFVASRRSGAVVRLPLVQVARRHPRQVLLVTGGYLGFAAFPAVAVTFMLGYASTAVGVASAAMLTAVLVGNVGQLVTVPVSGALADRWGPRPVVLGGSVAAIAGIALLFATVLSGNVGLIVLGYLLGFGILYCAGYGEKPMAFAAEFDAPVRYSGIAIGSAIGTVLGSGFGPLAATFVLEATGTPWAVAGYVALTLLLSLVCLAALTSPARSPQAPGAHATPGPVADEPAA